MRAHVLRFTVIGDNEADILIETSKVINHYTRRDWDWGQVTIDVAGEVLDTSTAAKCSSIIGRFSADVTWRPAASFGGAA